MRFGTRFAVLLATLTVLLHYYCSISECSVELQQVCRYTSPTVWDELLVEQSGFYKDHVHPVMELVHGEYVSRVEPQLLKLGSDVHDGLYVPMVRQIKDSCELLDLGKPFQWVSKRVCQLRRKVYFYYNVLVRPTVQKIVYRLKLDEFSAAAHSKVGPFLEKTRFVWHYLRPYTVKARSSVAQGYSDLKDIYYRSSHWMTEGSFEEKTKSEQIVTSSDSETETETEDEGDEEDEEIETSTMTSTVLVTVTLDENTVASQTDDASLEVSEKEAILEEFNAWFDFIDQKSSNLIKSFDQDVDSMAEQKINASEPSIKNKTNHLHQVAQQHFERLNRAIQDINCTSGIDTDSGEIIYFDHTGTTQLANYITRPLVRALFNETHSELESLTKEIEHDLQSLTDDVEAHAAEIREDMLELYEEWGDVMISEWSKILAYAEVVAVHFGDNDEQNAQTSVSSENWTRFLKLKKQVVRARDDLAHHAADSKPLRDFLNKAQWIIETVTKDSGEYLYILRARANLAFQERERQERERSAHEMATRQPPRSANGTIPGHLPDHVEDPVHRPVEESAPAVEDLQPEHHA